MSGAAASCVKKKGKDKCPRIDIHHSQPLWSGFVTLLSGQPPEQQSSASIATLTAAMKSLHGNEAKPAYPSPEKNSAVLSEHLSIMSYPPVDPELHKELQALASLRLWAADMRSVRSQSELDCLMAAWASKKLAVDQMISGVVHLASCQPAFARLWLKYTLLSNRLETTA